MARKHSKDMLGHFFRSAAENVRRPIPDVTGQSRHVDEALGGPNSSARIRVSAQLHATAETLEKSNSLNEWRALIE